MWVAKVEEKHTRMIIGSKGREEEKWMLCPHRMPDLSPRGFRFVQNAFQYTSEYEYVYHI